MSAPSATRSVPGPRKRAPAKERRAQICDAALACFAARGYHATTMDDIVRASGLSKGTLYWHFPSKEEVFLACFDTFAVEVFAAWDRALERDPDVLTLVREQLESLLDRFGEERALLFAFAEFLSHPAARERMAAIYATTREKLAEMLRVGIAAGQLRELPAGDMAAVITALGEGMLLQAMVDRNFDAKASFATLFDVLARGIAR